MGQWALISPEVQRASADVPVYTPQEKPAGRTTIPWTLIPLESQECSLLPVPLKTSPDRETNRGNSSLRCLIPLEMQEAAVAEKGRSLSLGNASTDAFLDAMLDQPTTRSRSNFFRMPMSILAHAGVLGVLLVAPLYFTDALDLSELEGKYRITPLAPPLPPPAPYSPTISHAVPRAVRFVPTVARMTMPRVIPRPVSASDDAPPDVGAAVEPGGVPGGMVGGVSGGVPGGILGGILGGEAKKPGPPSSEPPSATGKRIYRVGGNILRPRQIVTTRPEYPIIARNAKIQGVVVVDAVIDENGDVVDLHAVSGPPLLISAALKCVAQWKFEPTHLNGAPISVALRVEVTFGMVN